MPILSFATGNLWRFEQKSNRASILKYIAKLPVDGIELTFAKNQQLFDFKPTRQHLRLLHSKEYVTIHAPFSLSKDAANTDELEKALERIQELKEQVNAKYIVIHPHQMPPTTLLKKYKLPILTENMRKRRYKIQTFANGQNVTETTRQKRLMTHPILETTMDKTRAGLCMDVGHAYAWNQTEIEHLVKRFKPRIKQIHLHSVYRNKDHRQFLRKHTQEYIRSIQPALDLNVPIVIEEDFKRLNLPRVRREIRLIKDMLQTKTKP
ncbi:MAG: sugar phosphate isomerase/epimerase [Candidatus Diapherotrites archaeon]|nr:sugar phosphate isomerase/epimerase [Candidatus Diapherotrites archaeon]